MTENVREPSQMSNVKTELRDRIYEVTIARPPVNALNQDTYDELREIFAGIANIAEANVVVLKGDGRGFSPGADIKDILHETVESRQVKYHIVDTMIENLVAIPVPVICSIHGFCLAAGMKLASHCDIRIASEEAVFGMPEVDRGLTAGSGGSLRRLNMPTGFVREMIFTGRRYSARQMRAAGFLEHVVHFDELDATVASLAATIAGKQRSSLVAIKNSANIELRYLDESEANKVVHDISANAEITGDSLEGIRAFLDGREPSYTQR
jgi:enoyl-CoA hydratase/carnithine racemase